MCSSRTHIEIVEDIYYERESKSYPQVGAFVSLREPYPVKRNVFIPTRITLLAEALGWDANSYGFLFIVSSKAFAEFEYQARMTVSL